MYGVNEKYIICKYLLIYFNYLNIGTIQSSLKTLYNVNHTYLHFHYLSYFTYLFLLFHLILTFYYRFPLYLFYHTLTTILIFSIK
jgi:hypothetical protein